MKKYLIILLALVLAVLLISCDKDKPQDSETSAVDTSAEVTAGSDVTTEAETTTGSEVTTIPEETTNAQDETTAEETTDAGSEETTVMTEELSGEAAREKLAEAGLTTTKIQGAVIDAVMDMTYSFKIGAMTTTSSQKQALKVILDGTNFSFSSDPATTSVLVVGSKMYAQTPIAGKIVVDLSPEQLATLMGKYLVDELPIPVDSFGLDGIGEFDPSILDFAGKFNGMEFSDGSFSVDLSEISGDFLASLLGGLSDLAGDIDLSTNNAAIHIDISDEDVIKSIIGSLSITTEVMGSPVKATLSLSVTIDTESDHTLSEPEDKDAYMILTFEDVIRSLTGGELPEFDEKAASALGLDVNENSYVLSDDIEKYCAQAKFINTYADKYVDKLFTIYGEYSVFELDSLKIESISVFDDEKALYGSFVLDSSALGQELPDGQFVKLTAQLKVIDTQGIPTPVMVAAEIPD